MGNSDRAVHATGCTIAMLCSSSAAAGSIRTIIGIVLACAVQCAMADKHIWDVDWSDPGAAAMELAWRVFKVCLALSPLICITLLFCCTKDDAETEELRRKKKFDFSLA